MRGKRLAVRTGLVLAAASLLSAGAGTPAASAQERIVGGSTTGTSTYTFMASLRNRWGSHFCGGTLVAPRWVLTASHCVKGTNAKQMSVVVGRTTLNGSGGVTSKVSKIYTHPSYGRPVQYAHDAALLLLSSTASTTTIPVASTPFGGDTLTTAGWGTTSEGGSCCPNSMQAVDVPVLPDSTCESAYGSSYHAASMICAGEAGKDSCQGDSGGPLFDKNARIQYGTVSWGYGCAREGYPGVYGELNAPAIREWIRSTSGV